MSKNKRAPSVLSKYVVTVTDRTNLYDKKTFKYFSNQREAKAWAKDQSGRKALFRINYDYYGDV